MSSPADHTTVSECEVAHAVTTPIQRLDHTPGHVRARAHVAGPAARRPGRRLVRGRGGEPCAPGVGRCRPSRADHGVLGGLRERHGQHPDRGQGLHHLRRCRALRSPPGRFVLRRRRRLAQRQALQRDRPELPERDHAPLGAGIDDEALLQRESRSPVVQRSPHPRPRDGGSTAGGATRNTSSPATPNATSPRTGRVRAPPSAPASTA